MTMMWRVMLGMCVLSSVLVKTSLAQTCKTQSFSNNKVFKNCHDLSQLTSYLHWTYDQPSGILDIAFRHGGITTTNRWVAWGINPNNDLVTPMIGAQALVYLPQSSGNPRAYTTSIANTATQLQESSIRYPISDLSATYSNNEVTIFATLTLPNGTSSIVHVWQDGPLSASNVPQEHRHDSGHQSSMETLYLVSGQTQQGSSGASTRRKRNMHGVVNAVSWGVLMPMGAVIARYLKVFKSTGTAWFYLHVACQVSAYIVGVAGLGTGLKLGDDYPVDGTDDHKALGIIMVALGTLQVFALFLRPNPNHKYRFYWNVYHHIVGYATIIISITNIFKGFDVLEKFGDYNSWKHAYIGIIGALGAIAVFLEVLTWIIYFNRKGSENKMPPHGNGVNGANGVNGYASRPQQV
ncbi:cytochrome b561 and DOMON domain-containing protein At5g47530-like [Arachis stenosperma]|uniref:cytochrome b561 and DOMON domain-containing protein At5g47530-like n=1 Tax=Arachis stenosperma TaxID=217475 RepID=UPI0025ACEF89|nr:cytochrome b561 and DOMON domain-containing protein At5g47530-like [Arachis stenosperma]